MRAPFIPQEQRLRPRAIISETRVFDVRPLLIAGGGLRSLQHAIYLREIDVTEHGRNDAALRNALSARRFQNQSEEPQHCVVAYPTSDFLEYDVMSHRMAGRDRPRSGSLCGASPARSLSRPWPHRAGMAPCARPPT